MDTSSVMSQDAYKALAGHVAGNRIRVYVSGNVGAETVTLSVECSPALEDRARKWAARQARVNHWDCEPRVEQIISI